MMTSQPTIPKSNSGSAMTSQPTIPKPDSTSENGVTPRPTIPKSVSANVLTSLPTIPKSSSENGLSSQRTIPKSNSVNGVTSQPKLSSKNSLESVEHVSVSVVSTKSGVSFSARWLGTAAIMAAYFGVTLTLGMIGPSLLDLQLLTSTTTSEISTIFTCRGVLAIASSIMMGPVLDLINHYLVVAFSMITLFVFLAVTPWSTSLLTILLTMGPPEFVSCAIGMAVHLIGLELWQDKAGPVLQALNLVSIVGFMLAPLLVQPFLATMTSHNVTDPEADHAVTMATSRLVPGDDDMVIIVAEDDVMGGYDDNSVNFPDVINGSLSYNHSLELDTRSDVTSDVKYAYWIAALYCWIVGIFVFFVARKTGCNLLRPKPTKAPGETKKGDSSSKTFVTTIAILFFIFNIFLAGIEVGYAGLLLTFAVDHLGWSKESATWAAALQQAANCVVTASCIPLSHYVAPNVLLATDLVLLNAVVVVEASCALQTCPAVMWACTAGVGAGYAVIMPSSLTWLDTFLEVSGKFSSVYWAGYFVGFMAVPALSGFLFYYVHPLCFIYVTLGCAVGMGVFFVIISVIVYRHKRRTNGNKKTP